MNSRLLLMLLLAGVIVLLAALTIWYIRRKKHPRPSHMDEMEGHDFEYYCADLLKQAGFEEVHVTRGSGDFGADILAEKDGVTYAVQCKCYDGSVGVAAVAQAYAAKDYYDRMVGAVMSNRYFTGPAVQMAEKLNVLLWDRDWTNDLAEEAGYGSGR